MTKLFSIIVILLVMLSPAEYEQQQISYTHPVSICVWKPTECVLIDDKVQQLAQRAERHYRRLELNTAALAVAECESNNSNVRNRQGSSASGYWQFVNSTWRSVTGLEPPAMAYPRYVQREAFEKLWNDGQGWRHWAPSKSCWEEMI